jgi:hypothetical protein
MTISAVLDAAGRRQEIIAVMRQAADDRQGARLRALIIVLRRGGLRIQEALTLGERDLDPRRGSLLVQAFDGQGGEDRYIREAMFGGAFGAFRSGERHCFDEGGWLYRELAKVLALRREKIALRRGRQYLREISGNGVDFGLPRPIGGELRSVVPWSRIFVDDEILVAINTDPEAPMTAWVTIDDGLHAEGGALRCLYSTDEAQVGQAVAIEARHGKAVRLTVPAAGFVIFE